MIVGEAYVEIHAVTNAVRKEIKDGFTKGMSGTGTEAGKQFDREIQPEIDKTGEKVKTKLRTKMGQAGDEGGRTFVGKFASRIAKSDNLLGNLLTRHLGSSAGKAGDDFGRKFFGGIESHFKNASVKSKLLGGLTSFIGPALATVGQLSGGLFSIGASAAQAAGALPVVYGGLLSIVSAAEATKLGLSGVGSALSVLNNKASTPAAISKAMSGLSPPAKAFVKQLHAMNPELQKIKTTAAKNLLPGLLAGLKAVKPLFPLVSKEVGQLDKSVGSMGKSLGKALAGPLKGTLQSVFNRNSKVVHTLTGAVVPLATAFLHVYHAMQPVIQEMANGAKKAAELAASTAKVNDANGHLTGFFQRSYDKAKLLFDIMHNLGTTLVHVAHAAQASGNTMLQSIDKVTAHWATMSGTAGRQNSMQKYFQSTIPVMHEVAGIIGDIFKDLVKLGGSGDLVPLLKQIRTQLLPALDNVLKATTGPVASNMVQFLSDLAKGFAVLAGSGSTGYLSSFITSLDSMVKVLDKLISLPGVGPIVGEIGSIAGAVAAFGLVLGKLRLLSFAKNLLGFGGAAKTAAKSVAGLETAKAAEKIAMDANNAAVGENIVSYGALSTKVEGTAGKLKTLGSRLRDPMGLGGTAAITAVSLYPDAPTGRPINQSDQSAIKDAKRLQAAGATATRAAQIVASTTPTATKALNAWAAAEEGVASKSKAMIAAQKAMQHSITNVTSSLNAMGTVAGQVGSVSLKGNTNAAKANRQALTDAANSVKAYRRELVSSGTPLDEVKRKTDSYAQQLKSNAIDVYGNKKAVDAMLKSLGATIPQLDSVSNRQNSAAQSLRAYRNGLIAAGTPLSDLKARVAAYASQLTHVPRGIVSKITADTALARAALQTLKTQIDQLPDHTVRITTTTVGGSVSQHSLSPHATGGWIKGPGTGTSDSILARLSNNEFVVNAKQALKNRHLLEQINAGAPGFASGGSVSASKAAAAATAANIQSGIQSRQQNLAGLFSGLARMFVQAIYTNAHAVGVESNRLLKEVHAKVGSLEAYYNKHGMSNQAQALRHRTNDVFGATYAIKVDTGLMEQLAVRREAVVKRLQKAQTTLNNLQQARSSLIGTIRSGIASYSDVTQIVPQGIAVTGSRIDINLKYRLAMVKKWAANIKTLIRRGLNKTTLQDIINQGPDTGGPYAQALVDATKQQIASINKTESQIQTVSKTVSKATGDAFYASGIEAAKGLVNGLKSREKELNQAARTLGQNIAKALKKELGIHSPSKVGFDIGANIPHAVSLGIHNAIPLAENAATKMAARVSVAANPNRLGMLGMVTQGGGGATPASAGPLMHVEHLHVRDDSDIDKIAQALYRLQTNTNRAAGRATLPATTGSP